MRRRKIGELVSRCASLAALLEVSAYPKPGNVHRLQNFQDTIYEHFLASSVVLSSSMQQLAKKGYNASQGSIEWKELEIGKHVLEAVTDSLNWQKGGNVNLGIAMLFAPIAAAGGAVLFNETEISVKKLRIKLRKILGSTTSEDAINVYEAIRLAMKPSVLDDEVEYNVWDERSTARIKKNKLTLIDIFNECAERDSVCREWISDFEITFEMGRPFLKQSLRRCESINHAIVNTFLNILSNYPDSLIKRKRGIDTALKISNMAKDLLDVGGTCSKKGLNMIWMMDRELQKAGGKLNPGTTADLTAASIFIVLLEGWRP